MKIPKCTKTVSGKHKWRDGSYYSMFMDDMWGNPFLHIRPTKCEHCGMIDDRTPRMKGNRV